jgi:lipopolysaccharide biosynthesis glycosyltransferase
MIPIFIGYDAREAIAYHVCSNSIIRNSSQPVSITPLALNLLKGVNYDQVQTDGSNEFIYSRFLVPFLQNYQGWAIFIDGDMAVCDDIVELWNMRDDKYAALVVQHQYKTRMPVKYLGARNEDYPRKNWSSVILWNCAHAANQQLTPVFVQSATGAQLHRFTWLNDSEIGSLPIEWNWLPDEFGANPHAKLLHWTLGTPCFSNFEGTPMNEVWHNEKNLTLFCQE